MSFRIYLTPCVIESDDGHTLTINNATYKSYKAWQNAGRQVLAGEKHTRRSSKNIPLFTIEQTDVITKRGVYYNNWDDEDLWDAMSCIHEID